jgi:hypothetical protein
MASQLPEECRSWIRLKSRDFSRALKRHKIGAAFQFAEKPLLGGAALLALR